MSTTAELECDVNEPNENSSKIMFIDISAECPVVEDKSDVLKSEVDPLGQSSQAENTTKLKIIPVSKSVTKSKKVETIFY